MHQHSACQTSLKDGLFQNILLGVKILKNTRRSIWWQKISKKNSSYLLIIFITQDKMHTISKAIFESTSLQTTSFPHEGGESSKNIQFWHQEKKVPSGFTKIRISRWQNIVQNSKKKNLYTLPSLPITNSLRSHKNIKMQFFWSLRRTESDRHSVRREDFPFGEWPTLLWLRQPLPRLAYSPWRGLGHRRLGPTVGDYSHGQRHQFEFQRSGRGAEIPYLGLWLLICTSLATKGSIQLGTNQNTEFC